MLGLILRLEIKFTGLLIIMELLSFKPPIFWIAQGIIAQTVKQQLHKENNGFFNLQHIDLMDNTIKHLSSHLKMQ